jgi:hypothetical protein
MAVYAQEALGGSRSPEQQRSIINPRPMRLGTVANPGDGQGTSGKLATRTAAGPGYVLAPATVLATNTTTKVRVQVSAWATYYVLVKLSAIVGTVTVNGYPMLADAVKDESIGTRAPTGWGLPTSLSLTDATATLMTVTSKGEEFFEIEVVVSSGGSDTATIAYIDVFGV